MVREISRVKTHEPLDSENLGHEIRFLIFFGYFRQIDLDQTVKNFLIDQCPQHVDVVVDWQDALHNLDEYPKGLLFVEKIDEIGHYGIEALAVSDPRISPGVGLENVSDFVEFDIVFGVWTVIESSIKILENGSASEISQKKVKYLDDLIGVKLETASFDETLLDFLIVPWV